MEHRDTGGLSECSRLCCGFILLGLGWQDKSFCGGAVWFPLGSWGWCWCPDEVSQEQNNRCFHSLDGLLSVTKKLIIPSDLMRRLQPKKNIPKTTVSDNTHITAIWTTLMRKRLLSSGVAATKPLSVTTDEKLQQNISSVLLKSPALSVWLKAVEFISTFQFSVGTTKKSQKSTW